MGNDGQALPPYLMQAISQKTVLCNLSPTNRFRLWCHNIAFDARFDAFILTLILISSALLAVEDPVRPEAQVGGCVHDIVLGLLRFQSCSIRLALNTCAVNRSTKISRQLTSYLQLSSPLSCLSRSSPSACGAT